MAGEHEPFLDMTHLASLPMAGLRTLHIPTIGMPTVFQQLRPTYQAPEAVSNPCARTLLYLCAALLGVLRLAISCITLPYSRLLHPLLPSSLRYHVDAVSTIIASLAVTLLTLFERLTYKDEHSREGHTSALTSKMHHSSQRKRPRLQTAAELVVEKNDCPFCLVHGVFGWGEDAVMMPSYWGGAELLDRKVFVPSVGPISSHHVRAVELFYQLKGGRVDYGEDHAALTACARFGKEYDALYPEWSEANPLHMVGHSMGGDTARTLQHLLANGFFETAGHKTSASWIISITCVSTPLNGTTCVDFLGLSPDCLSVRWFSLLHLVVAAIMLVEWLTWGWLGRKLGIGHYQHHHRGLVWILRAVLFAQHPMINSGDWCVSDLSVRGAMKLNAHPTYDTTYYFSYVTKTSRASPVKHSRFRTHWPAPRCHPFMMTLSACVGRWTHTTPVPCEGWKDQDWWENDGPVPVASQAYPHVCQGARQHRHHPIDSNDSRDVASVARGCWQYSPCMELDHMSVCMNPRGAVDQQKQARLFVAILKRGRLVSMTRRRSSCTSTDESVHHTAEARGRATTEMRDWEVLEFDLSTGLEDSKKD